MTEILIPVSTETSTELVEKAIIPENGKIKIFVILQKISELHLNNKKMTKQAITKNHSCISNEQHPDALIYIWIQGA